MSANDAPPVDRAQDSDLTAGVAAFAAAVASRQPTPGGGSVAGVVAALAAALGSMVCRFTPALADVSDSSAQERMLAELDRMRTAMLGLAEADAVAYAAYRAATALPKATDHERGRRREAMRAAMIEATEVPLAIARGCARLRLLLAKVAMEGNPHLRSDAEIGLLLAEAASRGSLLNVRGNLTLLRDAPAAERYRAEADELERGLAG
ncbi:MAG: cyclodeaminase/cyclohydrolase family protein [Chloroflexota bacterium]|nr:cyclodeaminase/cyclohydrolase family protein [Chloroflexota bacterium]